MNLETQIINGFLFSEEFTRKVAPFVRKEYFTDKYNRLFVEHISKFFDKYNRIITKDILETSLLNRKDLTQEEADNIPNKVNEITPKIDSLDWLLYETEKYFQKRSVYLAVIDSIQIIEGQDNKRSEDAIPSLLQDALSVSFDSNIGHDYIEDAEDRFDFYHTKEEGILFDLDIFNKITDGVGLRKKSLTICAAATGAGKSIFLCHVSASTLMQGKNVLYITLEMSEKRIAERIDANLMDTPISQLKNLDQDTFNSRIKNLKQKTTGKLVVKEYPTGAAHAGHFRALLEDLKNKKGFIPDLICVDYLNICSSQRVKNNNANSYTIVKSIAEELRSLAVTYNVPVLSATQVNRDGLSSSDVEMGDTSESVGTIFTVDLFFALMRSEELDELGQVMIKQLKNRYGNLSYYKKFVIGLDASKMKFYNLENSAQGNMGNNITSDKKDEDIPIFDKSKFGKRLSVEEFTF